MCQKFTSIFVTFTFLFVRSPDLLCMSRIGLSRAMLDLSKIVETRQEDPINGEQLYHPCDFSFRSAIGFAQPCLTSDKNSKVACMIIVRDQHYQAFVTCPGPLLCLLWQVCSQTTECPVCRCAPSTGIAGRCASKLLTTVPPMSSRPFSPNGRRWTAWRLCTFVRLCCSPSRSTFRRTSSHDLDHAMTLSFTFPGRFFQWFLRKSVIRISSCTSRRVQTKST